MTKSLAETKQRQIDRMNERLREASGNGSHTKSAVVAFLYQLMRDEIPAGKLADIVADCLPEDSPAGFLLTNAWLAQYASFVAQTLDPDGGHAAESENPAVVTLSKAEWGLVCHLLLLYYRRSTAGSGTLDANDLWMNGSEILSEPNTSTGASMAKARELARGIVYGETVFQQLLAERQTNPKE